MRPVLRAVGGYALPLLWYAYPGEAASRDPTVRRRLQQQCGFDGQRCDLLPLLLFPHQFFPPGLLWRE